MDAAEARTQQPTAHEFLASVLHLRPRVAAFDCDGTLWSGDAGESFFDWELQQGSIVPDILGRSMRERYADYKAGNVDEETMCGELVTMHQGISELAMMRAATQFMEQFLAGQVFPEMRELVNRLQENGCEVWAVSSSNEWVIRAGMQHFGIGEERILATKVELDDGIITNRLVRIPSGPGKPKALRDIVRKEIDASFGNSRWDREMLEMSTHSYAVNPNSDLEEIALQRGWTVYFPDGTRRRKP